MEKLFGLMSDKILPMLLIFLGSGVGLSLLARILNLIPLERWYKIVKEAARRVSALGNARFTRLVYEPIETFFQNAVSGTIQAINEGLDSDDEPEKPEDSQCEK